MCDNYIVIKGWMISELGLSGNELLVYAVIYGYSQDGENEYFGSLTKMSELLQIDKRTIMRILQRLCDAGLIHKRQAVLNNIQRCFYCATAADEVQALDRGNGEVGAKCPRGQNVTEVGAKCHRGQNVTEVGAKCPRGQNVTEVGAKCHRGRGKMPPQINKVINKDIFKEKDNINIIQKESENLPAKIGEKFQKPTVNQIKEYCNERNNGIDAQHFYDYYEACGWLVGANKKMKDWRAAVRNWERNNVTNKNTQQDGNNTRANRLAEARADIANALDAAETAYRAATGAGETYAKELFDGL